MNQQRESRSISTVDRHGRRPRRSWRLTAAAALAVLLASFAVAVALGQEALGGKVRAGNDIVIAAGETVTTDLYLAGGTLTVDGNVEGDLVATGGTITVNGSVAGDVLAAGGTVRIAGEVAGDVRVAGGQLTVAGAVAEDLLVAGGTVELASNGTVGEDVIASAGQLTINGAVTGSVIGNAGTYQRNGTVGGTDEIVVQPPPEPAADRTVDRVADAVRHFLVVVLVGLLALWLAPRLTRLAAATVRQEPVRALAWGVGISLAVLLLLIVIPIAVVLVAIVLGLLGFDSLAVFDVFAGIAAFLGLLVGYGFLAWIVADVVVGLGLALLVGARDDRLAREEVDWGRWALLLIVGAAVVVILTSLPIVGPWLKLLVVLVGVGALVVAWRARGRQERVTRVEAGTAPAV
jgi:cytoskeletal protein CcmA (bactofilin family)